MRSRDGTNLDPSWRTAIRDGECTIRVAGYSHVFTHGFGDAEAGAADQMTGVEGTQSGFQERYAPSTVREIMRAFADNSDATAVTTEAWRDVAPRDVGRACSRARHFRFTA